MKVLGKLLILPRWVGVSPVAVPLCSGSCKRLGCFGIHACPKFSQEYRMRVALSERSHSGFRAHHLNFNATLTSHVTVPASPKHLIHSHMPTLFASVVVAAAHDMAIVLGLTKIFLMTAARHIF